jgi:Tfp pilus assembly protein PilN
VTQVNLLPSDIRERQRTRRLAVGVGLAVAAVVALLFFVFVLQVARLSEADQDLAAQQEVNSGLRAQISELQEFQILKQELAAREGLVGEATAGRVLWSGVLGDVSKIIPGQMWLTNLTGTLTPPPVAPPTSTGAAAPAPTATLVGNVTFTGRALNNPTIARWLSRIEDVTGWVNPWVSGASQSQDGTEEIDFSGSFDFTTDAVEGGSAR